jgi:hypothetical protein
MTVFVVLILFAVFMCCASYAPRRSGSNEGEQRPTVTEKQDWAE